MHEGSIDWKQITEDDFNRAVEALLMRKYHQPPESTAEAIDGRGGDGGIDVVVRVAGKIDRIFQLKHFPEGFSGGFRQTRRPQIKGSFDTAWENHKPPRWTLVVPRNPTIQESRYVTELGKGKETTPTVWGPARLDSEFARHGDLLAAATRNPLVATLKTFSQERAALAGPADLPARVAALRGLGAGRSLYWDVDFAVSEQGVTQVLRAKHPQAAELEPLGFRFSVRGDVSETAQDLRRAIDYGTRRRLTIPGSAVSDFSAVGPEWFQQQGDVDRIEMVAPDPLPADQQLLVTVEFVDDDGFTTASHQGLMIARSAGVIGVAFVARFYGMLELDAEIPVDPSSACTFAMKMGFPMAPVRDVQSALHLLGDFKAGSAVRLLIAGQKAMSARVDQENLADQEEAGLVDASLELLVDDLSVLEGKLNAKFVVPESLSNRDRVMIRVARLLTDGKATWMPPETMLTMTLSGEPLEEAVQDILTGGCAVTSPLPAFAVEIQGSKFNLGPAVLYHRSTVLRDAEEVLQALAEGTGAGREVVFVPQGDQLIWVMPEQNDGETVDWDLPGIPVPHSELQELPAESVPLSRPVES